MSSENAPNFDSEDDHHRFESVESSAHIDTDAAYAAIRSARNLATSARVEFLGVEDPRELFGDEDATWTDLYFEEVTEIEDELEILHRYLARTEDLLAEAWFYTIECEIAVLGLACGLTGAEDDRLEPTQIRETFASAWLHVAHACELPEYRYVRESDRPLALAQRLRTITKDFFSEVSRGIAAHTATLREIVDGHCLYDEILQELPADHLFAGLANLDAAAQVRTQLDLLAPGEDQRLFMTASNRYQNRAMKALRSAASASTPAEICTAAYAAFTLVTLANNRGVQHAIEALSTGHDLLTMVDDPEAQLFIAHRNAELHLGTLSPLASVDALMHSPSNETRLADTVNTLVEHGTLRIRNGRIFGALAPLREAYRMVDATNDAETILAVAAPLQYALTEATTRACAEFVLRDSLRHISAQRELQLHAANLIEAHQVALRCTAVLTRSDRPDNAFHAIVEAWEHLTRFTMLVDARAFPVETLERTSFDLRNSGNPEWAALCAAQQADVLAARGDFDDARTHAERALQLYREGELGRRITNAARTWMLDAWPQQSIRFAFDAVEVWRTRVQNGSWIDGRNLFERLVNASSAGALAQLAQTQRSEWRAPSLELASADQEGPATRSELAALGGRALLFRAEVLSALGLHLEMQSTYASARRSFREADDLVGELECELSENRFPDAGPDQPSFGPDR
ncbi:MAG: hypothetical protein ACOYN3_08770 [Acidimicrobiia bacterium]